MPQVIICLTTTNRKSIADKIARFLVKSKISACVNIVENIHSSYRWKGKVEKEKEYLLIIKTDQSKLKKLKSAIQKFHNYQVPELLIVEAKIGITPYLRWFKECLG